MSEIGKRIAAAREAKGMNQSELARTVGVTPQAVQKWEAGGAPKGARMQAVASALGTTVEFLLTGGGQAAPGPEIPAGASIQVYESPEDLDPDAYVWVERYDVNLSAGCGNLQWVINQKDPICFRARWFQFKRLSPNDCKALYVRGRSMEPKLNDWDTVLIDTAQTDIIDGEIYAVCLHDEFFIKTVERISGGIKLKSENPDFESIEVRGEELGALRIIGKMVWRGG